MDGLFSVRCLDKEHMASDTRFAGGFFPYEAALQLADEANQRAVLDDGRSCVYEPRAQDDKPILTREEAGFVMMSTLMHTGRPPLMEYAIVLDEGAIFAGEAEDPALD